MMEKVLREKGHETRIITQHLPIFPAGVDVLKHIPLTQLYAEETVFQVSKAFSLSEKPIDWNAYSDPLL